MKTKALNTLSVSFILGLFVWGCSTLSDVVVPELPQRTLQISPDFAGFYYQWRHCEKWFFGSCRKWEIKQELYDLSDPGMRKQLIDMGFVVKVREKILP